MSSGFWIPVEAFWLTGGWPPVTYNDTPSGGLVLGSAGYGSGAYGSGLYGTAEARVADESPATGLRLGGSNVESRAAADTATGGLRLGGTVAETRAAADAPAGGVRLGGVDTDARTGADAPALGFTLGGQLLESWSANDTATGGLVLAGVETDSTTPIVPPPVEGGLQALVAMLTPRRPPFQPRRRPLPRPVVHAAAPVGGVRLGGSVQEQHLQQPTFPPPVDPELEWRRELEELLALNLV